MKIATRLATALSLVSFLLFAVYGVWALRAERDELWTAVFRETRLLARSLQVSMESALGDRQWEEIRETMWRVELVEPHVDVLIYDHTLSVRAHSIGSVSVV